MMFSLSPSPKALQTFYRYQHGGILTEEDAEESLAYLVIGKQGHYLVGNCVIIYWFVDQNSGKILHSKFQYFGHPYLLILAETVCQLVTGKIYTEVRHFSFEDINLALKPQIHTEALPEAASLFHMILDVLDILVDECRHLPITNIHHDPTQDGRWSMSPEEASPYTKEAWDRLSTEQQLALLKQFIEEKITPFVSLDEGAVSIDKLEQDVITIAYSGNCSSCFSSLGSTLNSISQMVQTYVYAGLKVKVNEASLNFSPPSHPDTPHTA